MARPCLKFHIYDSSDMVCLKDYKELNFLGVSKYTKFVCEIVDWRCFWIAISRQYTFFLGLIN